MADSFPDEIWLKILLRLDLRSKGRVACVCHSLQRIVKEYDDILWCKVDLINKQRDNSDEDDDADNGDDDEFIRYRNMNARNRKWQFPPDENSVLCLARGYFGAKLLELHLHVINTEILQHLSLNCPNLKTITLHHDKMALRNVDLSNMPSQVRELDLCLKGCFRRRHIRSRSQSCHFAANPLKELGLLTVRYTEFSDELFDRISNSPQLQELTLHHCSYLSVTGFKKLAEGIPTLQRLWLRHCLTRNVHNMYYNNELELILNSISSDFRQLKSFKLQLITKGPPDPEFDFAITRLQDMTDLRCLWLENIDLTSTGDSLLSALKDLKELHLVNCDGVTDDVMAILSRMRIERLNVKGSGRFTEGGFKNFTGHPCLEYLNIAGCRLSYDVINSTVPTMLRLKWLYISQGYTEETKLCITTLKSQMKGLNVHAVVGPYIY